MTNEELKGKWNQIKGKVKQKYGSVTDDDLTFAEGKFDEMLGRVQEKTGKTKEQLRKEFGEL
ncbi:CsbD family protein [Galbibacter mesophilus]|uniref:CsbD family protein n=1 Tax=Galbibacter mesophilus TaxID=379069 RepID=UPI00191F2CF2|nr:CsbD family protein [Galbibacter mesophilus]MCM5664100.1 CsbD family protein [Galbibacter mesophilus]